MRSPSGRCLTNLCDIFPVTLGQDQDGGTTFAYPATPNPGAQPCSAQPVAVREVIENDRITRWRDWEVMFGIATPVSARDQLVITDNQGNKHTAFVEDKQDQAGRGSAFVVYAVQKL
jgi:hypothetical protein